MTARFLLVFACLALVACGDNSSSPTLSPAATGSAAPSMVAIVLNVSPDNLSCDSIGVDYTRLTFHIDRAAAEQVSATTDTGASLVTYWPAGFTADEGGVRDDKREVVVTDGQSININEQRIYGDAGVCFSPTTLHVGPAGSGN